MTESTGENVVPEDGKQGASGAPYMSYKSFKTYLEKFQTEGLPDRLDQSYFGNASGSLVAQVRGALRYLDLIDDNREPTDALRLIVDSKDDEQKAHLRELFEAKYADALALSKTATSGQLADVFRDRGLSGDTIQKAISFFLAMAADVDVEVSPLFKKGRVAATSNGGRRRKAAKPDAKPASPPPVHHHTNSAEQQRSKYVEMLMDLATKSDGPVQTDLLDRIERALGYDNVSAPKGATETS